MKVKSILSLTVFIAAFVASAALVSLTVAEEKVTTYKFTPLRADNTTRLNIVRFLERDIGNGDECDRQIRGLRKNFVRSDKYFAARKGVVIQYVEQSSALDESHLPQDLQIAWLKHMRAWHKYSDYLKDSRGFDPLNEDQVRRYNHEINTTWDEVLRIGRTYDAHVREY